MKYRLLGATGIAVSEIGFGAWGVGGATPGATSYGPSDDKISLDALRAALDRGITFYDTANCYGDGHSESLLGQAFGRERDKVVIATKAGMRDYKTPAFTGPEIASSLEGSLERLRTDYVDLLQLHGPPLDRLRADGSIMEALARLKAEGKVRAAGISVNAPEEGIAAIEEFGFEAIQVNLNLADQRARACGLLDLARQRAVGIIARTPLCFGFLSGRLDGQTDFDASDHRSAWPREQIETWVEAGRLFASALPGQGDAQTRARFALGFCLSSLGVSTVIPGMMRPEHVDENAGACDYAPFSKDDMETLARLYDERSFFIGTKPSKSAE